MGLEDNTLLHDIPYIYQEKGCPFHGLHYLEATYSAPARGKGRCSEVFYCSRIAQGAQFLCLCVDNDIGDETIGHQFCCIIVNTKQRY